ncbi:TVP38/TMEM64 family protein [Limosilactobacillus sp.]|uniref:TVP38/TMEM64 family protein n=1 Tax=Limosilactobacillus sp. TaxID=2773925 RepID=UPI003F01B295
MTKKLNKPLLITAGVIVSLILIYFIYRDYRPEIFLLTHMNAHNKVILMQLIRSHGIKNMLLLLALIATFNAIPGMSNSFVCIFTGLCYGPVVGFIVNWIGNILGNCGVMSIIHKIDLSKLSKKSKLLSYLLNQRYPLVGLTIGFMVPVIPSVLVNYAGARMKVSWVRYLVAVVIGMAPTSFIYAFGGDALFKHNDKRLIGAVIAIIVVIAMFVLIKKLIKRGRRSKQEASL